MIIWINAKYKNLYDRIKKTRVNILLQNSKIRPPELCLSGFKFK